MLTSIHPTRAEAELSLFDPTQVEMFLSTRADVNWPEGVAPRAVHIERVWPVDENALAVEWSFLLASGERVSVHALPVKSYRPSTQATGEPSLREGVLRGFRLALPEQGIEIHTMDHDAVLTVLPECLDPGGMARRLAPHLQVNGEGAGRQPRVDVHPLSYRARRRATIRYRHGEHRLIGKVFRDQRGERAMRTHVALRERLSQTTGGRVTVPAPVGYLPDLRMLLLGWNHPRELSAAAAPVEEMQTVMQALSALHRTAMEDLPGFSSSDEIAVVQRWATALATAAIPRTDTLRRLIPVWRVQTPPGARGVTLHRDFYPRQVLLGADHTTLIDLDTLSSGDAAVDVGNFLAHRWLDALQHAGTDAARQFDEHCRESLVAYQASGSNLRRSNLRWYWASALLRLGAVHALRTTTGRFSDALWTLSARLIGATSVLEEPMRGRSLGLGPLPDVEAILSGARE